MDRNELIERINRCAKKAAGPWWVIATGDEDFNAELYVDEEERIWLYDNPTPFTAGDVSKVKWWAPADGNDSDEPDVTIRFNDGGRLTFSLYYGIEFLSSIYELADGKIVEKPRSTQKQ